MVSKRENLLEASVKNFAFSKISSHSFSGSESQVIPEPIPIFPFPFFNSKVRIPIEKLRFGLVELLRLLRYKLLWVFLTLESVASL